MIEIKGLLEEADRLRKAQEVKIAEVLKDISKIPDEKVREYLLNSVTLARKGELNVDGFLKTANKLIADANGDTNKQ